MAKKYYHATSEKTFYSILDDGEIKVGWDGIIYLTEKPEEAVRFIALRLTNDDIYVLEIEVPDPSLIEETFDHSYNFFKCKSFGYPENIPSDNITNVYKYGLK